MARPHPNLGPLPDGSRYLTTADENKHIDAVLSGQDSPDYDPAAPAQAPVVVRRPDGSVHITYP